MKRTANGDKLSLFRQQGSIIARKKEGTAQRLKALTDEVNKLEEEYSSKNNSLKGSAGSRVIKRKARGWVY